MSLERAKNADGLTKARCIHEKSYLGLAPVLPQATSLVEELQRRLTHICVAAGILACIEIVARLLATVDLLARYQSSVHGHGSVLLPHLGS